jgi:hypothetical protein
MRRILNETGRGFQAGWHLRPARVRYTNEAGIGTGRKVAEPASPYLQPEILDHLKRFGQLQVSGSCSVMRPSLVVTILDSEPRSRARLPSGRAQRSR